MIASHARGEAIGEGPENRPELRFAFSSRDGKGIARTGVLTIGRRAVETPCVWLGANLRHAPHLRGGLRRPNLIVSATDLGWGVLGGGTLPTRAKRWFRPEGRPPLMMDSGGFHLINHPSAPLTPERVARAYRLVRPEIGAVLDIPFSPHVPPSVNARRWTRTLENTRWMLRNDGVVHLMPVIHGHSERQVDRACDDVLSLGQPRAIGLGSMVPLLRCIEGTKRVSSSWAGEGSVLQQAVLRVRERFPRAFLHVFGIGSLRTMAEAIRAGADSFDSSSWRMKAAHGAILLPHTADRFVTPRPGRRGLDATDLDALSRCRCPVCWGRGLKARRRLLDNGQARTFGNRALHNAWTVRHTVALLRRRVAGR